VANALYDAAKKAFLDADIDLLVDTIKVQLVDAADYTVNLGTHDNFDDVPAAARVGTAVALANKSTTAGVFDADDVTLTTVTGDQSEALVLYKDTGTESTSKLIAYIDTATGLPITPSGGNITIVWDSGASKIFKL
jgi:hypothetical protein